MNEVFDEVVFSTSFGIGKFLHRDESALRKHLREYDQKAALLRKTEKKIELSLELA